MKKGSPKGGYGNRLNSVISSLLIAILLDAQINIKWKHIENYINASIVRLFDFEIKPKFCSKSMGGRKAYVYDKDINLLAQTHLPLNFHEYSLDYADAFYMEICANKFYYKKLAYYKLVSEATLNLALEGSNSLDVEEKEKKLFHVGFEVGGNILNRIWRPTRHVQDEIEDYIKNVFKLSDTYVIGIQLRYGSKLLLKNQSDGIFLGELHFHIFYCLFFFFDLFF